MYISMCIYIYVSMYLDSLAPWGYRLLIDARRCSGSSLVISPSCRHMSGSGGNPEIAGTLTTTG